MVRTKRCLSHFEAARSTPHRAPPPATSNTFVATPLHVPHPSQRGGCIACPSSACVPSPCPPTDPSPTAIQHCLSVPASVVLLDARAPPTARLCLPFVRHRVLVRPVCPSYVYVSVALPRQYPKVAPLAPASYTAAALRGRTDRTPLHPAAARRRMTRGGVAQLVRAEES